MSYTYVVTSQKPNAVSCSLCCSFTSPTDKNLIIAKGSSIEVHLLKEDGIDLVLDEIIYDKIQDMESFRPINNDHGQDYLFLLTENRKFCVLKYDQSKKAFETVAFGNVNERVSREVEAGTFSCMEPDQRMIGLYMYEGQFKVSYRTILYKKLI